MYGRSDPVASIRHSFHLDLLAKLLPGTYGRVSAAGNHERVVQYTLLLENPMARVAINSSEAVLL